MLTMRRTEFADADQTTAREVLDAARYAQVATSGPDGVPEIRPLNYARVDDTIYLHCAEGGTLAARAGTAAVLSAVDQMAWLPSRWRHPQMACPATTWYRSVQVRGVLRAVETVVEKGRALEAFMRRYQPEGGHLPLDDPRYAGPLRALVVLALPLHGFTCKVKVGQHLTDEVRARMQTRLEARGWHDDWGILRLMERANGTPGEYPCEADGLWWTDDPRQAPVAAVHAMLAQTYWAADRPLDVVDENLRRSTLTLTAWDEGRLVAHARAVVSHPKVAWVFDVVLDEAYRGRGLGTALMRRVLEHRSLRRVLRVFLDTRDAMPFYARLGFEEVRRSAARESSLMVLER